MENEIIPDAALNYIKDKKLKLGFSYKDVWNEEHATAFTVAKVAGSRKRKVKDKIHFPPARDFRAVKNRIER